ncbi:MAG: rod shape-determining protein MreD [Bacteroidetes bacterium]|nr:rod shape-determining protein MreD [Bacteroidota bacterium]
MFSRLPINILRFIALLAVQVLIFSKLNLGPALSPYICPYVYPLFILLLPFGTPQWLLMILGFVTGLILDFFLGAPLGMHGASCLLIAYLRPFLISIITPKGAEFEVEPNIFLQGVTWFLIYCGLSAVIYHTFYFLIESWTFYNLFISVARIFVSSAFSVLFMMMFLFLFTSGKKRRLA